MEDYCPRDNDDFRTAKTFGLAYNAAVGAECRKFAVNFLKEAQTRLGSGLRPTFQRAMDHYKIVAQNLRCVSDAYPFSKDLNADTIKVDDRARAAATALRGAREAEAAGLDSLAELAKEIPLTEG